MATGLAFWAQIASAHEFWISPEEYQVLPDARLQAHLRVGQEFDGNSYSFFPNRFVRFDTGPVAALAPVDGRLGDRPALSVTAQEPGLWLVVHETTDNTLIYRDWTKFEAFVARHDLGPVIAAHHVRGLPEVDFRETYRRYGKSLIAVGDGAGADRRVGLAVEIVAEANPYALDGATLPVRMWQDGAPRGGAQLEVFTRLAGEVSYATFRSDADGRVDLPAPRGAEILLNFVVLDPRDGNVAAKEPVWHSRWASLTFRIPD